MWKWRIKTTINDRLANILDKMLLPAASERFQSGTEVLEALFPPVPIVSPTAPQHHNN